MKKSAVDNRFSHLPVYFVADQQNQVLSNELFVTLPLDTKDIMLPTEAYQSQRKRDETGEGDSKKALLLADENLDDMYKEVLKIQPGSPHDGTFCPFFTSRIFANTLILQIRLSILLIIVTDLTS